VVNSEAIHCVPSWTSNVRDSLSGLDVGCVWIATEKELDSREYGVEAPQIMDKTTLAIIQLLHEVAANFNVATLKSASRAGIR
jgi:hypothetical protein